VSRHNSRFWYYLRVVSLVLLACATLVLAACSDDPTDPFADRFGLRVRVVTPDGAPVPGLRAALSPALDDRYVIWPYAKARDLPPGAKISYHVYDLDGRQIRHITRESAQQFVIWTGLDDNGLPVHDGVYRFTMEIETDDGIVSHAGYLVFVTGDPDHFTAAVTDANGSFTERDPTYVPAHYGLEPIEVITYPEGTVEQLELLPRVRVTLLADDGSYQAVEVDVARELQILKVVWEPKVP